MELGTHFVCARYASDEQAEAAWERVTAISQDVLVNRVIHRGVQHVIILGEDPEQVEHAGSRLRGQACDPPAAVLNMSRAKRTAGRVVVDLEA